MFYGRAGHLDEFCFCRKRIEKMRFDYARNSYRDEFIDFPPRTSSCASPHFFHGPNHRSYGYSFRENNFVPRCYSYGPRPHRGDRPRVGMVFPLEVHILTLSRVALTVHTFPIVVHVPLTQMVRCKGL
jgi:hypothetical protein